jgi:septal ring factor EnvC (AmiA/AmiB activator)
VSDELTIDRRFDLILSRLEELYELVGTKQQKQLDSIIDTLKSDRAAIAALGRQVGDTKIDLVKHRNELDDHNTRIAALEAAQKPPRKKK